MRRTSSSNPCGSCRALAVSLGPSGLKLQKTKLSKNFGSVSHRRSSLCLASARLAEPETLADAVFAEPLAHLRVRCDQREGHFSGTGFSVNIVSRFSFRIPQTFCQTLGRFSAPAGRPFGWPGRSFNRAVSRSRGPPLFAAGRDTYRSAFFGQHSFAHFLRDRRLSLD